MSQRLTARIESQGSWLYRKRSIIGVVPLPLLVVAIWFPWVPGAFWSGPAFDSLGYACIAVSFLGLVLRWFIVGFVPARTSVRSTREMLAAELNTSGAYSLVRHPLYVANTLIVAGFFAATGSAWFLVLSLLMYALFIERVAAAEERFVESQHGQAWRDWVARTPAFIPAFSHWQASDLSFSVRTVLRREYNGFFNVMLGYFLLEAVHDVFAVGESWHDWFTRHMVWSILLLVGIVVLLVLRTLNRYTRVLKVEGR